MSEITPDLISLLLGDLFFVPAGKSGTCILSSDVYSHPLAERVAHFKRGQSHSCITYLSVFSLLYFIFLHLSIYFQNLSYCNRYKYIMQK
jgi:hypothetical protein